MASVNSKEMGGQSLDCFWGGPAVVLSITRTFCDTVL